MEKREQQYLRVKLGNTVWCIAEVILQGRQACMSLDRVCFNHSAIVLKHFYQSVTLWQVFSN